MPYIINTRDSQYLRAYDRIKKKNIRYEYPDKLDLKPGSPLHEKLKTLLIEDSNDSSVAIQGRRENWKEIERTLTAYIPADEAEAKVKAKDQRKPISIVIPISLATLETTLTYYMKAFITDPIFKFDAYGPNDVLGAMMLEGVVQQNAVNANWAIAMHTWWRDGLSAGFGAITPVWFRSPETRKVSTIERGEQGGFFSRIKGMFVEEEIQTSELEIPAFEGDILYNIDYRNFLPDPTVPVHETHKANSAGWIRRTDYITLLEEELANDGLIFNVKYLQGMDLPSILFDSEGSTGRSDKSGSNGIEFSTGQTQRIDVIYRYKKIIPSDLGVGDSDVPEIWLFAIAGDKVIIQANPIDNKHGMLPIAVHAPDFDGHSLLPVGRMEIINGLQVAMNWMFNSHVTNVRKAINDMLIVDPSLINMNDLSNPAPGKLIRLRRSVWGRGVKDAVMQLPVADITRNNMGDANMIMDLINRVSGAVDSVQGIMRTGSERRSATEFSGTMQAALSRLEKTARISWLQGMLPLQKMVAEDNQQYMSAEQYVRLNGDWQKAVDENLAKQLEGRVSLGRNGQPKIAINPDELSYAYDIIPHDGTSPGSGDAATWLQIFQIASSSEAIQQRIDVYKVFKHLAMLTGAKNIDDFEIQPPQVETQVSPDEQVMQQAQAGNVVPLDELPQF